MAFLEKVAQQAAAFTTLEKDEIQLETEQQAKIEVEQEEKFKDDLQRF